MTTIRTRLELKRAIDGAWDAYESKLIELGKAINPDWELSGLAAAHAFIGQPAADAYEAFKAEQVRLNVAYGQHSDAPALVVLIRKDHDIAVHNATASLKSAEYNRDQLKQQLDRITAGEFAQYGITEPSADESARLAARQQTVDDAQATLEQVRETAAAKRDAALENLERIRPGVTSGDDVEPEPDTGPTITRQQRSTAILEGFKTYEGPYARRGHPRRKPFGRHIGMRDVTREEIRAMWSHAQRDN